MVSKSTDSGKDEEETENLLNGINTVGYSLSDMLDILNFTLENILKRLGSNYTLVVKVMQPETSSCCRKAILQNMQMSDFDRRLCEFVVHTDEKYSVICTESVDITASNLTLDNRIAAVRPMEMRKFLDSLYPAQFRNDLPCFVSECSLVTRNDAVVSCPVRSSIIRSIRESKSVVNIVTSPLFHQNGVLGKDSDFGTLYLDFSKDSTRNNFMNSPSQSSVCSTSKPNTGSSTAGITNSETEAEHRSFMSLSSSNSTSTDKSSSSFASAVSHGMLHYTWKGLSPCFVFSLDEQREVYVANPMDVDTISSQPFLDLTYLFYWKKHGKKDRVEEDLRLVGKMKVATTFTLCPNNSKIMETEIVLWGTSEISEQEMLTSESRTDVNKGLLRKVSKVLKNIRSSKQKTLPQIHRTSTVYENYSLETCQNVETVGADNVSKSDLPPNLELAAIIMKDHVKDDYQEEPGGWGLKFLKKVEVKKTLNTPDAALLSDCCAQDCRDCSSSMEIIVSAGLHGGPMTRHDGPSTLIERWKSGGCCDCSGWDLGCPLTIFNTRSSREESLKETDDQEECKSFDVFVQGLEHSVPSLRITNVRGGLHVVHFQSTFSALQSFSIAVAYILKKSNFLHPKMHRN